MAYKNLPNLRFSGFSEEWKEEPLENIIEFLKGNDSGNYKLPILTISAGKGWMLQSDRFGNVLAGNELKNYTLLKKGQLSYNHGNSKLAKYGAVFSLKDYNEALVPKVYHSFKILNGDSDFIERLFESKKTDRQLRKMITSGARMDGLLNINKQSFGSILINFPTLIEQQKIGDFFAKQDKLIELQTQKVDQLKKLKRGYLQKMFPQEGETVPRLRFSGFSGEWKEVTFGECYSINTGKSKYFINDNGKYAIAGSKGIIGYDSDYDYSGSFVMVSRVGEAGSMYELDGKLKITDNTIFIQTNYNKYLSGLLTNRNINKLSQGSGRQIIKSSDLKRIKINTANFSEQKKINDCIILIDKILKLELKKLNELKRQKKAYLQKMFI
ncbi:hypothetical protein AKUG0406_09290 [Apilactobacillus kunkeei]|nr:hypothetical protein AKUG0406_09290 [Apilactobacillus kunkeei]CAI2617272.1 hypothetical protein AKUG0403_09290 [Apilactobacillus kunkeei]CAI2619287.1 hypothetical protein AKUH3B205J_09350 [Apilactobacillus kunkeei]CAI2619541.1 hypothetical protein AKUH3B101A_09360 [Apilactobacillus kunkeei]CAI2619606.1 hypothetical protein AKUH3B204J_09360 [Apilactobacillus kunkeei]